MVVICGEAQSIIDRLGAIDYSRAYLDPTRAEAALAEHFMRLHLEPLPVRWVADAEVGLREATSAAWLAAESAARLAAESAAESAGASRLPAVDKWIGIWLPFVDATEAGLWVFWVLEREVIAVPRPAMQIADNRLQCADGPAVAWPDGASYYFWRGLQVPARVILTPEQITAQEIVGEGNLELRRVMLERVGTETFIRSSGARLVHRDDWGELYRQELPGDEALVMVKVVNATPEPDGSFHDYWIRVDSQLRPLYGDGRMGRPQAMTALNAVASTFGMIGREYAPCVQT